jgi:hypothetical protein
MDKHKVQREKAKHRHLAMGIIFNERSLRNISFSLTEHSFNIFSLSRGSAVGITTGDWAGRPRSRNSIHISQTSFWA